MPKPRKTGVPRAATKTTKLARSAKRPPAKPASIPAAIDPAFTRVIQAFAADRSVTTGGKFGSTSLMRAGKVFVMLMKGNLVAKLPATRVAQLEDTGLGTKLVMGKRAMKEWVVVAAAKDRWTALAREAYGFVDEG
jgi:hypothetical protein